MKARAEVNAEKVIDALVGSSATTQTKERFKMLRNGELDDQEIEIELLTGMCNFKIYGNSWDAGGMMGMINLGEIFGKALVKKNYL